jgi:hypothetical protein
MGHAVWCQVYFLIEILNTIKKNPGISGVLFYMHQTSKQLTRGDMFWKELQYGIMD